MDHLIPLQHQHHLPARAVTSTIANTPLKVAYYDKAIENFDGRSLSRNLF